MASLDFATGIAPSNPLHEQLAFKTIRSEYEGGNVTTKKKWLYQRRNFKLKYNILSVANAKTLYDFFIARSGSFQAFVVFLPFSVAYTGEYVGVGDGSTTAFNAPGKTISSYTVYVDGVSQTEGGGNDYTVDATGGTDGEAEINFVAGSIPAAGDHITIDFTGYLKVRCRFAEDMMDFENFYNVLVNTGISLKGELNT